MRKVQYNKKWYSESIIGFEEALLNNKDELSIDVWFCNELKQWCVTTRNSFTRGTEFFGAEGWRQAYPTFDKLKTAKKYAEDCIEVFKVNPETHYTNYPNQFDDKYFNLDVYGTETAPQLN